MPGLIDMNSDPEVMAYFPAVRTVEQSKAQFDKLREHFAKHGFTFYAAERLDLGACIGFIGFAVPGFEASFTPCIEIGWRLQKAHWGQGFATEGALACLAHGFSVLGFTTVYSFTAVPNKRSERVMQKIGMQKTGHFDHPRLEQGHWLERHVLYRIDKVD